MDINGGVAIPHPQGRYLMDTNEFEYIKSNLTITAFCEAKNIDYLKSGATSFRLKDNPSLTIFDSKHKDHQMFADHGPSSTPSHGSVIDFAMNQFGFKDKQEALNECFKALGEERTRSYGKRDRTYQSSYDGDDLCKKVAKLRNFPDYEPLKCLPILFAYRHWENAKNGGKFCQECWALGTNGSPIMFRRLDGRHFGSDKHGDPIKSRRPKGVPNRPVMHVTEEGEYAEMTEGEADAIAIWIKMFEDGANPDQTSLIVCGGAGVVITPEECRKIRNKKVRIWVQKDAAGLSWALENFYQLEAQNIQATMIVPDPLGWDWGDYYIKGKFQSFVVDPRNGMGREFELGIIETQIEVARERESARAADEKAKKQFHINNGKKGGKPISRLFFRFRDIYSSNPELSVREYCRLLKMEYNPSNKRKITRWKKKINTESLTVSYGEETKPAQTAGDITTFDFNGGT
jgi:hypothetical protein